MTDTRPRAEKKAREKRTGSARQQAKEALREEISTFNGAGVKKIHLMYALRVEVFDGEIEGLQRAHRRQ